MSTPQMWGSLRVEDRDRRELVRAGDRFGLASVDVESNGLEPVLRLTFVGRTPASLMPDNISITTPPATRALRALAVERRPADDTTAEHVTVRLAHPGGAGTYRLRLVEPRRDGGPGHRILRGLDARFAELAFSFDVQRPVHGPPDPTPIPKAAILEAPNSYLARDYAGLRRLLLDRLAVTQPLVREEHAADLNVMLVELFAYLGDDLAYRQDDVATEAYLATARRRISVRRHGRLVGYRVHEGCAARAWLCVEVREDVDLPLAAVRFAATTSGPGADPVLLPRQERRATTTFTPVGAESHPNPSAATPTVALRRGHNDIGIWTFGEQNGVLCAGATRMTLRDSEPRADDERRASGRVLDLQVGDVLVLEAVKDPSGIGTGDPAARHPVRLTGVQRRFDDLLDQELVEVQWSFEDALPFDLVVSASVDGQPVQCAHACGNVVLVEHGEPASTEVSVDDLVLDRPGVSWAVPFPAAEDIARQQARELRRLPERVRALVQTWQHFADHGRPLSDATLSRLDRIFGRLLDDLPVGDTVQDAWQQADLLSDLLDRLDRVLDDRRRRAEHLARRCESFGPLDPALLTEVAHDWDPELGRLLDPGSANCWGAAADAKPGDPRGARPVVVLEPVTDPQDAAPGQTWTAVPDLLRTAADDSRFVAEVDDAGRAHLRLDPAATRPVSGRFIAHYRVGNGVSGNVPAEAINAVVHVGPGDTARLVTRVRNPLPATGGTDPEEVLAAKRAIPGSYGVNQPRALDAADYAREAELVRGVGRAAAEIRVTGSHRLVSICVRPTSTADPSAWFLREVRRSLIRVRRIGDEIRVLAPQYRPLYVRMELTIAATTHSEDVLRRVGTLLSSGRVDTHTPAMFHPSQLEFGRTLWASAVVAAVQEVGGVVDAVLLDWGFLPGRRTTSQPQPAPSVPPDRLRLAGLQLPRLDNDPVHPDRGYATLTVRRTS
jgi:predicted phage baseplate assembly protein